MKHTTGLLLLVALSLALASCQKIAEITSRAESIDEQAAEAVQQHYPGQPKPDLLTSEINSSYLGSRQPVQVVSESPPPPGPAKGRPISLSLNRSHLTRLAQLISDHTGVHIEVDAELASASLDSFEWSGTAADVLDSLTARPGGFLARTPTAHPDFPDRTRRLDDLCAEHGCAVAGFSRPVRLGYRHRRRR